jgi:hypothetical protein
MANPSLGKMGPWLVVAVLSSACSDDGLDRASDEDDNAGTAATASGSTQHSAGSGSGAQTVGDSTPSTSAATETASGGGTASDTAHDSGSGSDSDALDEDECVVDEDCELINDCCACTAGPIGETPPACPADCEANFCDAFGLGEIGVVCRFGTCQLRDVQCNPAAALCGEQPPTCGEGLAPRVDLATDCWGECIPAEACNLVGDCSLCGPGEVCVPYVYFNAPSIDAVVACEPIPEACAGQPDCECMMGVCGEELVCLDTNEGPSCDCPEC